jgi:hypothetical protein
MRLLPLALSLLPPFSLLHALSHPETVSLNRRRMSRLQTECIWRLYCFSLYLCLSLSLLLVLSCPESAPSPLFLSISLFCSPFLFLMQCRSRFRLNGGFAAGFVRLNAFGFVAPSPFLFISLLLAPSLPDGMECFVAGFVRLDTYGFIAQSPFFLFRSLLLATSLPDAMSVSLPIE